MIHAVLVAASLVMPAQLDLVDPPCGTVVSDDESSVTYTQDVDCSAAPEALRIEASNVTVDGGGHTIVAGPVGIAGAGADGLGVFDLALDSAGGAVGVDVTGSALVIVDTVTVSGFLTAGLRFTSGTSDIAVVDCNVTGAATCALLDDTGGDNEVDTSTFTQCAAAGVDARMPAGATLVVAGNSFASTLTVGTALAVSGLVGPATLEQNLVAGYGTAYALTACADVALDVGDLCGIRAKGVTIVDSARTHLLGSLNGFDVAVTITGASTGTLVDAGFSHNTVDVLDQGAGATTQNPVTLVDTDVDGIADVCDAQVGGVGGVDIVVVVQLAPGDSHCAAGGVRLDTGVDVDGDGALGPAEVTSSGFVCDGLDGSDGSDGTNGHNGLDGSDGADGADGANGADGADGLHGEPGAPGANGEPGFVDGNNDDVDDRAGLGGGSANCAQGGMDASEVAMLALLGVPMMLRAAHRRRVARVAVVGGAA